MYIIYFEQCTNRTGVEWLKRHLEPQGYTIHTMIYKGIRSYHADVTVIPLRKYNQSNITGRQQRSHNLSPMIYYFEFQMYTI